MSTAAALESFRAAAEALAAAPAPPWLAHLRRDALAALLEQGLPDGRREDWRGAPLAEISATAFVPGPGGAAEGLPRDLLEQHYLFEPSVTRLVFINGRFAPAFSAQPGLPAGVHVLPLARAAQRLPILLRKYLGRRGGLRSNPFLALNGALFEDAAVIHLEDGAELPRPVHLLFATTNGDDPVMAHPRILVVAGARSRASIVESHLGPEGGRYLANSCCEVHLGPGATVEHARAIEDSDEACHLGRLEILLEAGARFRSHLLSLGGALARTGIEVAFAGPGGECSLDGLMLGDGKRHAAVHSLVDHAVPDCRSQQEFRCIAGDAATGDYTGRVLVRPGARGTCAGQSCRSLLLSDAARADARPQLEIHNDDVQCAHGVAIGQLDPQALFYLRSRGLGEAAARSILTLAFAGAITERIQIPALRCRMDRMLAEGLGSHVGAGSAAPGAPVLETV